MRQVHRVKALNVERLKVFEGDLSGWRRTVFDELDAVLVICPHREGVTRAKTRIGREEPDPPSTCFGYRLGILVQALHHSRPFHCRLESSVSNFFLLATSEAQGKTLRASHPCGIHALDGSQTTAIGCLPSSLFAFN